MLHVWHNKVTCTKSRFSLKPWPDSAKYEPIRLDPHSSDPSRTWPTFDVKRYDLNKSKIVEMPIIASCDFKCKKLSQVLLNFRKLTRPGPIRPETHLQKFDHKYISEITPEWYAKATRERERRLYYASLNRLPTVCRSTSTQRDPIIPDPWPTSYIRDLVWYKNLTLELGSIFRRFNNFLHIYA